jgi:hypothetical protein
MKRTHHGPRTSERLQPGPHFQGVLRVSYYVIIDPAADECMVLEPIDGNYVEVSKGHDGTLTFTFDHGCCAPIDFSKIWA